MALPSDARSGGKVPPLSLYNVIAKAGCSPADATAALAELDKGLLGGDRSAQVESVEFFPRLITCAPSSSVANEAILKLTKVFVEADNTLRLRVLLALQQATPAIRRCQSYAEVLRHIASVSHSNDPVSRALTVLTLGTLVIARDNTNEGDSQQHQEHQEQGMMASALADATEADADDLLRRSHASFVGMDTDTSDDGRGVSHAFHIVRQALSSQDPLESMAALRAAAQLCQHSALFATGVLPVLQRVAASLMTLPAQRTAALTAMAHVHHTLVVANATRQWLLAQLPDRDEFAFRLTALRTLSLLAAHRPEHVDVHLTLMLDSPIRLDPRPDIRHLLAQSLSLLSRTHPHLWSPAHLQAALVAAKDAVHERRFHSAVLILRALTRVCAASTASLPPFDADSSLLLGSPYAHVALCACECATMVALHHRNESSDNNAAGVGSECSRVFSYLATALTQPANCASRAFVRRALRLFARLLPFLPDLTLPCELVHHLATTALAPHTLSLLSSFCEHSAALLELCDLPALLTTIAHRSAAPSGAIASALSTLVVLSPVSTALYNTHCASLDLWALFRLGRAALVRSGHARTSSAEAGTAIARDAFSRCVNAVRSENLYFWLVALGHVAAAEHAAVGSAGSTDAQRHFNNALVALSASATVRHPLTFTRTLMTLRIALIDAWRDLRARIKANADLSQAHSTRTRFTQLARQLTSLAFAHADIDPSSLTLLCELADALSLVDRLAVFVAEPLSWTTQRDSGKECTTAIGVIAKTIETQIDRTLSENNFGSQKWRNENVQSALSLLSRASFPYPQYFFRTHTGTTVTLATVPSSSAKARPVITDLNVEQSVRVEGQIVQKNTMCGRRFVAVLVSFSVATDHPSKPIQMTQRTLRAQPRDDFFSCSATLSVSPPRAARDAHGAYVGGGVVASGVNVTVAVRLEDVQGRVWATDAHSMVRFVSHKKK